MVRDAEMQWFPCGVPEVPEVKADDSTWDLILQCLQVLDEELAVGQSVENRGTAVAGPVRTRKQRGDSGGDRVHSWLAASEIDAKVMREEQDKFPAIADTMRWLEEGGRPEWGEVIARGS